ncbi:hypothetical protein A3A68_01610 [Candidatus Saccharibacteria bacterium RIFCSPLOWO2_01_FULL_48_13]|nr:MAG: hypothetical protein A2884_00815 [Candidatus Saccharibacteria bacterium RIFCSPHIGHO2_01_FULL_48_12]OGL35907.1 MAG: hypothetical protein A3F38_00180 [Candidatus Saccharibacteria bacterium RIFCSPHIGHO2_12_FULL_48_21]OGL37445.1 MAG: hypothetical protein A3A68_01610 [Candidatus Saccharibacteria bacterium RIFCSPLOWO2_01_FULL_48_13]
MIIIGHRGARGLANQNTKQAIDIALSCQVDAIELDVRVTKDGVAVLNHDRRLSYPDQLRLKISQHSYLQLKAANSELLKLEDAIRLINRRVPVYLEIKSGVTLAPVVKTIKKMQKAGWKRGDFLLGSFSQKILLNLHQQLPKIDKIVIERWSGIRATWRARQLNTRLIAINQLVMWGGFISAMNHRGYKIYAYTLNDPARARLWARRGLAGVVTDFPDRFTKKLVP